MRPLDVPAVIAELIDLVGPPQSRLAKKLGVKQGTISKWLNKESSPSKVNLDKIQKLYMELKGWTTSADDLFAMYTLLDETGRSEARELFEFLLRSKGILPRR
jgi:transcriptional regulator with XRE-family HTH domain